MNISEIYIFSCMAFLLEQDADVFLLTLEHIS